MSSFDLPTSEVCREWKWWCESSEGVEWLEGERVGACGEGGGGEEGQWQGGVDGCGTKGRG